MDGLQWKRKILLKFKMDDLGVPPFQETSIWFHHFAEELLEKTNIIRPGTGALSWHCSLEILWADSEYGNVVECCWYSLHFFGTPLGCIGVLLVLYYMRCCHTTFGMLLGLGGVAEKTPLPCVAVCGMGREEPWRHYLKEQRITRTICRRSSSWYSWGFLVLSCFAEKLWL